MKGPDNLKVEVFRATQRVPTLDESRNDKFE